MADGIVQVAPDSTGKKVDTSELTVNAQTVERQRVVLADDATAAALAKILNSAPAGTEYALVTRPILGRGQSNAAGSIPVVLASDAAVTIFNGTVDAGNSSTTPLGISGVFTGAWIDAFNQGSVLVYAFSDKSSAANGVTVQWSSDGVNADESYSESFVAGGTAAVLQMTHRGRYFRVVYTNGAAAQTTFRLQVIHKVTTPSGDVEELSDTLALTDHGMITIPVLAAKNAAGNAIAFLAQSAAAPGASDVGLITRNIPSGTQTIQGVQDTATTGNIIASTTVVGPLAVTQRNVVTISVRGTYAGVTFIIEASDDGGTSWFPLQVIDNATGQAASTWTPGTNASASYDAAIGGFTHVRVRATAWTSGTAVVTLTAQSFAYDPVVAALSQGLAASGTAVKGFPVLCGGSNGTNVYYFRTDTAGNLGVIQALGTAATRWYAQISDGTNSPAIKAASTAAAATDPSMVVNLSPNMSPTPYALSAAATTNATSVKASAGTLFSITATNTAAATNYLKIYNKASAPTVGTDVPVLTIAIPAGGTVALNLGTFGYRFATGIAIATTVNAADSDTTALVAANTMKIALSYA